MPAWESLHYKSLSKNSLILFITCIFIEHFFLLIFSFTQVSCGVYFQIWTVDGDVDWGRVTWSERAREKFGGVAPVVPMKETKNCLLTSACADKAQCQNFISLSVSCVETVHQDSYCVSNDRVEL